MKRLTEISPYPLMTKSIWELLIRSEKYHTLKCKDMSLSERFEYLDKIFAPNLKNK